MSPPHDMLLGSIWWIKKDSNDHQPNLYGLSEAALGHPCVVVDAACINTRMVRVCVMTSMNGRPIEEARPLTKHRTHYLPIFPMPVNPFCAPFQLRLRDSVELRKDSFVNIRTMYDLPSTLLEPYDRHKPSNHYRLEDPSIGWLKVLLNNSTTSAPLVSSGALPLSIPFETTSYQSSIQGYTRPLSAPSRYESLQQPLYGSISSSARTQVHGPIGHSQSRPECIPPSQPSAWLTRTKAFSRMVIKALTTLSAMLVLGGLGYGGYRAFCGLLFAIKAVEKYI